MAAILPNCSPAGTEARRWNRGQWRAAVLITVHVLVAAHIAWWLWAGRAMAPAELNESMFTLEHGVLTIGFILMALALLSVLIFGRFFCSWGCHVLALQDLSAWALEKVGIRPKPVRLRLLLLVAPVAAAYMFLWPQVARLAAGGSWGPLRISTDAEGFGSLTTSDFLRNLPTWPVALVTFTVIGFGMVWLLGSRSFCTYACPYGAVFALADRAAPGRIRLKVLAAPCDGCAQCTAACSSHIRVHEEIQKFGRVVSPACMKDLDCVDACPHQAITFGFGAPSWFASLRKWGRFGVPYDTTHIEEVIAAAAFFVTWLTMRGLYGVVPFFLSMALAIIAAWAAIILTRLCRANAVRWTQWNLKRDGVVEPAGRIAAALIVTALLLVLHSATVRGLTWAGERQWNSGDLPRARGLLVAAERLAIVDCDEIDVPLANVLFESGDYQQARLPIQRLIERDPRREGWRQALAALPASRP